MTETQKYAGTADSTIANIFGREGSTDGSTKLDEESGESLVSNTTTGMYK